MTKYETIQLFQEELKRKEANARDSVVEAKDFKFSDRPLTKWASVQLANKIGIPTKYYRRMQEEEPELLEHNVNTWLKKDNRRFLVRELDGKVRAFLSDRYLVLSDRLICNTLAITLNEMRVPFEVLRQWQTECSSYVSIISPKSYDLGEGDTIQLGVIVRNSEVGFASFSVNTFMFRHYCKNGAIFGKRDIGSYSRKHIGHRMDISNSIDLSDTTRRLDIATTLSTIRDIIKSTFNPNSFESVLSAVKAGKNVVVEDKVSTVNLLKEQQKLSDELEKIILSQFTENTQYGLANAITATAKQLPGEEAQIELEELGGKIMLLGENEFKKAYTIKET